MQTLVTGKLKGLQSVRQIKANEMRKSLVNVLSD